MTDIPEQHLGRIGKNSDGVPEIVLRGQDLLERMRELTTAWDERIQRVLTQTEPEPSVSPAEAGR